jgi:Rod binding domain-containing protein
MAGIALNIGSTSTVGGISPDGVDRSDGPNSREKIAKAAEQFEGLMIHQLLKSANTDDGGWFGTGDEDHAGMQAMDIAQQQFASAMAARGGIGLAQLVVKGLAQESRTSGLSATAATPAKQQ